MNEDAPDDPNRRRIAECAAACLDHIRTVRWGSATSEYAVTDRDLELQIAISVRCYSAKKEK